MTKKKTENPVLKTWEGLNEFLMGTDDENAIKKLLKDEQDGRKRPTFLHRIHARLNKVRADRERSELGA